jgi:hypothetical protein
MISAVPDVEGGHFELMRLLVIRGELDLRMRDLSAANNAFTEALSLGRVLVAADPASQDAKRDLSACLERVGDLAIAQGNMEAARSSYRERHTMNLSRLEASPNLPDARRDVGESLFELASLSGSEVRWTEVSIYWRAMKSDGILSAAQEADFAHIEQKATAEAAPAS